MKILKLKKNILIYFVIFGITPLLIGSLFILSNMYLEKKRSIYNQHMNILFQIDTEITHFTQNIEYLSYYFKKKYSSENIDIVKELINVNQNIISILVLNNDGIITDYASEIDANVYKGFDYSFKKFFKEIKAGKDSYWSEVYLSTTTDRASIAYSFKIDESFTGIFVIDLSSLNEYIKKFQSGYEKSLYVANVIGKNGAMIINPDKDEYVYQRKSIANTEFYKEYIKKGLEKKQIEFVDLDQEKSIGVYGVNEKLGWNIIVKDRVAYIFATFYNLINGIFTFLVLISLLLVFFSFKFSRAILEPLEEVSKNMGEVASGKHTSSISATQYEELNDLVFNFTIMQKNIYDREEKLRTFNENLEQKIDEKTKELKELNESLEEKVRIEVSKNQEKEKMLFEQSKMASMGEMIENIAHQWRQPLSVISTSASGMKIKKEFDSLDDSTFNSTVDNIVRVTKHLSQTIDDFRNFFKNSKEKQEFSIKKVISKNLNLMDSAFKSNDITVQVHMIKDKIIYGYENELTQAVLNILNNAKDVLKESNIKSEKYIFINGFSTPEYFVLSIRDNGGGIKSEIISKIFEPYFTTKHKSLGTGIGLYMTRQIINDHMRGSIEVKNSKFVYEDEEFEGAEFVITLPL